MLESDRIISTQSNVSDEVIDRAIRPLSLGEYIGQENVSSQMQIFIHAAKKRSDALDHVLIFGPPGLGKTTLANIIAHEMGVNLRQTSGPVIERAGILPQSSPICKKMTFYLLMKFIDLVQLLKRCSIQQWKTINWIL